MTTTIDTLTRDLSDHLPWHMARISCLAQMMLALFAGESVSLRRMAQRFSGRAQADSQFRRLQRFFSLADILPGRDRQVAAVVDRR